MSYIKLDDVNEEHLLGTWRVKNRMFNASSASHCFIAFQCIRFLKNNIFTAQNGTKRRGHWEMKREQEMIYNPQVMFHLSKNERVNSIITNLMTMDETHTKLILYFDSGFELVLEKDANVNNCRKTK
ncbi:hypothetical protein [Adhaeribacter terreus]|uniref:Lipocalin-like domain-containing protein n=1 Tax=Adhaeribacter terreus TaxID=529703 RepID=A0ABW0EC96_9BACT